MTADIPSNFDRNIQSVNQLMEFDRFVVDFALSAMKSVREKLLRLHDVTNPQLLATNAIDALERIQANDSLRPQYAAIRNQCVVLLVSYFGSAVRDIFREGLTKRLERGETVAGDEVKVSLNDLAALKRDASLSLADFVLFKRDISFQDMKSIARTFKDYFEIEVPRDEVTNDIILSQACRHVIVHGGGVVDRAMLQQVEKASPRTIKPTLTLGDEVFFDSTEVHNVGASMKAYVRRLSTSLTTE
jgi:hypothetical protein